MKVRKQILVVIAVLAGLLSFSTAALAAKPPGAGNGGGSGSDPPDYGDLIILHRNAGGIPILTADLCQQPVAFPSDLCPAECFVAGDPDLVIVDPGTCAVQAGCESCTQEVEFERVNEARAPDSVFEAQLEDVTVKLSTADCITLDPAGRLVASTVVGTEVLKATIDSPLQNLAIYRQLMAVGYLGADSAPLTLPGTALYTAARAALYP